MSGFGLIGSYERAAGASDKRLPVCDMQCFLLAGDKRKFGGQLCVLFTFLARVFLMAS